MVVSPYNAQVDALREALPAGVAVGTLYNYFPDRESLLAALFVAPLAGCSTRHASDASSEDVRNDASDAHDATPTATKVST